MRLTGGHARGRVLRGRIADGVRPTAARVREALFSIVGQDLKGQRVLDAFAGSGLLGFEAWSRGATVVAVERRPAVARVLMENARGLGAAAPSWSLKVGDARTVAEALGLFDGVLADPPYAEDAEAWLSVLAPLTRSWLVFETQAEARLPATAGALALDRARPFGNTRLWVYRSVEAS